MRPRLPSCLALVVLASLVSAAAARDDAKAPVVAPLKPEQPDGYRGNPTKPYGALRQDLTSLTFTQKGGGRYELRVGGAADAPIFADVDLRPFVPRVPALARGDATLTRIALMQREFNRSETKLGPVGDFAETKLANNCLRGCLWELILEKKKDDGSTGMTYHGWFDFPTATFADVFEQANGVKFADYQKLFLSYPEMAGFPVPLEKLRTVAAEQETAAIDVHAADPVFGLPEQKRKAHLLLTPGIATFGDFAAPAHQPVRTAKFSEPGYYDTDHPMSFDLAWLAQPKSVKVRAVKGVADPVALTEVEIDYANGNRLLIADAGIAGIAPLAKAPEKEGEVLRLTFGIETPDIYATVAERTQEFTRPRANYLMLLDANGNHLDNHVTGLDRAYLYRLASAPSDLQVCLVGYERIALVSHLSFACPAP